MRVKKIRLEKGFSQEELADMTGLHRTYIGMIERGEKNLTIKNISVLARAFDLKLSELFEGILL